MSFPTAFARAIAPLAILAAAVPASAAAQSAELAKVEAHLLGVQTMTASFTQTDQRGRSAAGTLQLRRPGRIRFQYGSGDLLLVADGSKLTFIDYLVGQKSAWPLGRTPLGVLLAANPNLKNRAQVLLNPDPRIVVVRARDPRQFGTLILAFIREPGAPAGLKLYGWTAIDAQNKKTTVKLSDQRYNVAVPDSAFAYAEPKKRSKK
ncbi:MAG: outer membrane lipoprotein carrier protein LolA [Sphingomicrobium sp.]